MTVFLSPGARRLLQQLPEDEAAFFTEAFDAGWTLDPEHEPPPPLQQPTVPRPLWADRKDVA